MKIINVKDIANKENLIGNNFVSKGFIIGNRVPKDYFITSGTGESDIAIHAGSYHLALKAAGIEMTNIITYSSILPPIAKEIPKPSFAPIHGEVMETIMAVANGDLSERLSAGIIIGHLYEEDSYFGGIVCEHSGNYDDDELEWKLNESLNELYVNGYSHLNLKNIKIHKENFVPQKRYGTIIVALCFISYYYPIFSH